MKVISAKILDATHLELSQPIAIPPGATIEISILDEGEDASVWRDAARDHKRGRRPASAARPWSCSTSVTPT